jgi:hypothetical protein
VHLRELLVALQLVERGAKRERLRAVRRGGALVPATTSAHDAAMRHSERGSSDDVRLDEELGGGERCEAEVVHELVGDGGWWCGGGV